MKPTLYWKYADLAFQLLMLLPLIWIVSPERQEYALIAYFSTAAWQIISCALTSGADLRPAAASRGHYAWLMIFLLGIYSICAVIMLVAKAQAPAPDTALALASTISFYVLLMEAAALIFLMPVMTVWYAIITIEEIRTLRTALQHRSEVHWKL